MIADDIAALRVQLSSAHPREDLDLGALERVLTTAAQGRQKGLSDAARYVDELLGQLLTDGCSVECTQALMEARDTLRVHAEMYATTMPEPG